MMRPPLFARHAGKRPWGLIVIAGLLTLHGIALASEFLAALPDPHKTFRWTDEGARVFSVGYHGNHLNAGDYTVGISVVFLMPQK